MYGKKPARTSDNHYTLDLDIPNPSQNQADDQDPPRIRVRLEHCRRYGTQVKLGDLGSCLVNVGILTEDHGGTTGEQVPQPAWPFSRRCLYQLLLGDYDNDWVLYGFEVQAYAVTLKYYNLHEPDRRGLVELGCQFSNLQLKFNVPVSGTTSYPKAVAEVLNLETPTIQRSPDADFQYVVNLFRHRTKTAHFFGLFQRTYYECMATLVRSTTTVHGRVSRKVEFSGEDYTSLG